MVMVFSKESASAERCVCGKVFFEISPKPSFWLFVPPKFRRKMGYDTKFVSGDMRYLPFYTVMLVAMYKAVYQIIPGIVYRRQQ